MAKNRGNAGSDSGSRAETKPGPDAAAQAEVGGRSGGADTAAERLAVDRPQTDVRMRSQPGDDGIRRSRLPLRQRLADSLDREVRHGHLFLFLPVFMGLGAALDLSAATGPPLMGLAGLLVAALLAAFLTSPAHPVRRCAAIALVAAVAGALAAEAESARVATTMLDSEVTTRIEGRVAGRERDEHGWWRYTIDLEATHDPVIARAPERIRLLARSAHQPVALGERIAGLARLAPPAGPVLPGGYDFAFNAYFDGIGAIGFFFGPPVAAPPATLAPAGSLLARSLQGATNALDGLRETIGTRIEAAVSGDPGAMAKALVVGEEAGISDETVEALRITGLAHILSISGLHMALAAGTLLVTIRLGFAFLPRVAEAVPVKKLAAAGALFAATGYLLISGCSVPAVRSWIMLAIMLVAVLLDRPSLTLRNIALAALLILAVTPSAVLGPSFQMSFAATAAIVSTFSAISRWRNRRSTTAEALSLGALMNGARFVAALAMTSLVAGAATGIFAAYHFNRIGAYGLIANLVTAPAISFVVMPMGLLGVLLMPFGLETWPLKSMGLGLRFVIASADAIAGLGGNWTTGRMPHGALIVLVSGFLLFVLLRTRLRLAGAAVMVIGLGLLLPPFRPPLPDILVSEDGRQVAIRTDAGLAANRNRPSGFVYDQWLRAMGAASTIKPIAIARADPADAADMGDPADPAAAASGSRAAIERGAGGDAASGKDEKAGAPDAARQPSSVASKRGGRMRSDLPPAEARQRFEDVLRATPAGGFACLQGDALCIGRGAADLVVATIGDLGYLAVACDHADLVVTPARILLPSCRSGALLLTGRTLRQTGAAEFRATANGSGLKHDGAGAGRTHDAEDAGPATGQFSSGASASISGVGRLEATYAVSTKRRPWTVARYYDWRTRRFAFESTTIPTAESTTLPTAQRAATDEADAVSKAGADFDTR